MPGQGILTTYWAKHEGPSYAQESSSLCLPEFPSRGSKAETVRPNPLVRQMRTEETKTQRRKGMCPKPPCTRLPAPALKPGSASPRLCPSMCSPPLRRQRPHLASLCLWHMPGHGTMTIETRRRSHLKPHCWRGSCSLFAACRCKAHHRLPKSSCPVCITNYTFMFRRTKMSSK